MSEVAAAQGVMRVPDPGDQSTVTRRFRLTSSNRAIECPYAGRFLDGLAGARDILTRACVGITSAQQWYSSHYRAWLIWNNARWLVHI